MSGLLDQPAVVILAAGAASVCLLLEVALPTVGLAGAIGLALGALAAWGVVRQDADWWPLLAVAAAVALWGGLIAAHRASSVGQPMAAGLFLAGALGYAATTHDRPAAITAAIATAAVATAYPRIAAAAERLSVAPPAVGMESFVGSSATVVDWDGGRGRVIAGGSRWSASGPADVAVGEEVVVTGASGLSLTVDHVGSNHG